MFYSGETKKTYRIYLYFALLYMVWGVFYLTYQMHKGHTDKIMVMAIMCLSVVIFVRLKLSHIISMTAILTLLAIVLNLSVMTVGMFFEIMWVGVLVGAIPIMFYIQDVKIYQYLHNLEEVKMQVQNQRNLASETMLREKHDIRHTTELCLKWEKREKQKSVWNI